MGIEPTVDFWPTIGFEVQGHHQTSIYSQYAYKPHFTDVSTVCQVDDFRAFLKIWLFCVSFVCR